ncbi:hypothetical protein [Corynebacterium pygosceleis]|uniref:SWIM-type domain-containing protein n=1 Tax=Corynebacterium pygosceleis TaxID=2800406 RepID=A0A9Q4C989_9CORY|nr:hypothetical protein [Corynebacterium pygosceleis]MCK7637945.1 hypothetical protein [Corynebacterium pygosceleis]MCK7675660.1 hypothetical protein [Corynebacterium pygosceleis]MCL0120946.1 hypothetical protein [Corynebacterium pygosceleis]MCX7444515.1 hypothetical protein [Corynebacterium pygosceleis]MCX7468661.1 hypothetical protein [Corynebacterium pygosceleis]
MSGTGRTRRGHVVGADNVIYANFGRTTRVTETPRRGRTRKAAAPVSPVMRRLGEGVAELAEEGRRKRGRAYADNGNVLSVVVDRDRITGTVAGSQNEPFTVTVGLAYRAAEDLQEAIKVLAGDPRGIDAVRRGSIPDDVLDVLLCADADELRFHCTCPDPAPVCKHSVAVAHTASRKLEAGPHLLYALRGVDPVSVQRSMSGAVTERNESTTVSSEEFWDGGELPPLPEPAVAPLIDDTDPDKLADALFTVSYTRIESRSAAADITELYRHLTRGNRSST